MGVNMAQADELREACAHLVQKAIRDLKTKPRIEVGVIDDPEIATYGAYQEFGWVQRVTAKQARWFSRQGLGKYAPHVGSSLVLPPRPFMRGTLQAKTAEWEKTASRAIMATHSVSKGLQILGMTVVSDIKKTLVRGGTGAETFEERRPLTMRLYANQAAGHRTDGTGNISVKKPLVKTGALLNSIGFQLTTKK